MNEELNTAASAASAAALSVSVDDLFAQSENFKLLLENLTPLDFTSTEDEQLSSEEMLANQKNLYFKPGTTEFTTANLSGEGILAVQNEIARIKKIYIEDYQYIYNSENKLEELISPDQYVAQYMYLTNFGFRMNQILKASTGAAEEEINKKLNKVIQDFFAAIERLSSFPEFQLNDDEHVLKRYITFKNEEELEKFLCDIKQKKTFSQKWFISTTFRADGAQAFKGNVRLEICTRGSNGGIYGRRGIKVHKLSPFKTEFECVYMPNTVFELHGRNAITRDPVTGERVIKLCATNFFHTVRKVLLLAKVLAKGIDNFFERKKTKYPERYKERRKAKEKKLEWVKNNYELILQAVEMVKHTAHQKNIERAMMVLQNFIRRWIVKIKQPSEATKTWVAANYDKIISDVDQVNKDLEVRRAEQAEERRNKKIEDRLKYHATKARLCNSEKEHELQCLQDSQHTETAQSSQDSALLPQHKAAAAAAEQDNTPCLACQFPPLIPNSVVNPVSKVEPQPSSKIVTAMPALPVNKTKVMNSHNTSNTLNRPTTQASRRPLTSLRDQRRNTMPAGHPTTQHATNASDGSFLPPCDLAVVGRRVSHVTPKGLDTQAKPTKTRPRASTGKRSSFFPT